MTSNLVKAVVAATGALVGYLIVRLSGHHTVVIRISSEKGECSARTDPPWLRVKRLQRIEWSIEDPDGCLGGANVELRFPYDDSPLTKRRPKDKVKIKDSVRLNARSELYKYGVWYVDNTGTEYEMEDPE